MTTTKYNLGRNAPELLKLISEGSQEVYKVLDDFGNVNEPKDSLNNTDALLVAAGQRNVKTIKYTC